MFLEISFGFISKTNIHLRQIVMPCENNISKLYSLQTVKLFYWVYTPGVNTGPPPPN